MKTHSSERVSKESIHKCYHCGEECKAVVVDYDEKKFCCDGCKMVYDLLKDNSLCTYYNLNESPGISPAPVLKSKFEFLDNPDVGAKIIRFREGNEAKVVFYAPKIHCSSCIWLLENLHKINKGIFKSSVNFPKKEISISFNPEMVKLSELAALLAHTGYEPVINLDVFEKKQSTKKSSSTILKIGLAGFCFGNIMMLSFPEYFSVGELIGQKNLKPFFGYLNLMLALPVFFYSASGFFSSAWKSIRYRYLNIDAPIALAILVTFSRSVFEILTQAGAGYLDSMSGIVFFMLIGRYFQDKTYETLSFERDYKSYFPVGVTKVLGDGSEVSVAATALKKGDRILVRNNELLPADSILLNTSTHIDYSFITGESSPVKKGMGDLIYAGGRQINGAAQFEVVNPTSQSYLTELWNKFSRVSVDEKNSFVDAINKYFTAVVLLLSVGCMIGWSFVDSARGLNAMTAVLIVACPCGLLLTSSFVNGNILRIFGRNRFYLKNASVIEKLSKIDTIIFDKTGTITNGVSIDFRGVGLSEQELLFVTSLAAQSSHPLSRRIAELNKGKANCKVENFEEVLGFGIRGIVEGKRVEVGSRGFVGAKDVDNELRFTKSFVKIDGEIVGYFTFRNRFRLGLSSLVNKLRQQYKLMLVSGDNDAERTALQRLFGEGVHLSFNNKPDDKEKLVANLRSKGHQVMMVGDGLNDAAALLQSDVGVAMSDDANHFSPASDVILDGQSFTRLADFIRFSKVGKKIIFATFLFSLIYNVIGLWFAVQGTLSPVVAAILMPLSSISIVLISTISTSIVAWRRGL